MTEPGATIVRGSEPQLARGATAPHRDPRAEASWGPGGGGGGRGHGSGRDLGRLARGGALNLIGALASGVAGFLLVLVVTRGLPTGEAGVFFEAVALFLILSQTAELGADTGLTRMIPRYRVLGRTQDLRRTVWVGLWPTLIASTGLAVAMYFLADDLSALLLRGSPSHEDALIPYVRVLALFLPISTLATVATSATRGFGTMVPTVILENFGRQGLRPVLAYGVIAAGLGSSALALSYGLPAALAVVFGFVWLIHLLHRAERRDIGQPGLPRPAGELAGEFWRFTAPRGVAAFFHVTLFRLDTLLLGALLGAAEASIYTAATRLAIIGFVALTAVQQVIGPQISELLTLPETRDRARTVYQVATQWLILLSWPVYLTLAIFAPLFLRVFRPAYAEGADALAILCLATLVIMATGPCSVVLVMGGKSMWALVNSGVALAANVALNLVLIPRYGMTGAAVAWAAAIVLNNVAAVVQVSRYLKLSPFGSGFTMAVGLSTACFGAVGLLVRGTIGTSFPAFSLFAVVAGMSYLALLWLLRGHLHLPELRHALRTRKRRVEEREEWRAGRTEAGNRARASADDETRAAGGGSAVGGTTRAPTASAFAAAPRRRARRGRGGDEGHRTDEAPPEPFTGPELELEGVPGWISLDEAVALTGQSPEALLARVRAGEVEADVQWGRERQDVTILRAVDLARVGLLLPPAPGRAGPSAPTEAQPGSDPAGGEADPTAGSRPD